MEIDQHKFTHYFVNGKLVTDFVKQETLRAISSADKDQDIKPFTALLLDF